MDYRWIEDIDEFSGIAGEWDALVASGDPQPFLLSDFIITWWKYFGKGRKLRIFVLYENAKIKGGLALCLERGGAREGFANILCHVGGVAANYTEPMYACKDAPVLARLVEALSLRRDWDVLCLTDVREGSRLLTELAGKNGKKLPVSAVNDHMNYAIDLSEGLDNYLSNLSSKLRRDLRSKRKHLAEKFGQVSLTEAKGRQEVDRCADLYRDFSRAAFAARNKKSNFENDRYADFFRDFLILMDGAGRLDAHVLKAGDRAIAISFAYKFGKGFNWVLTAFDYGCKYYRPGYILIEELLKMISARGETCYNWYGHGRFYKDQLCNRLTPLYKVVMARKTPRGLSFILAQKAKDILKSIRRAADAK
jgi:CelD/BcsL family acetyltransferase involved in cellulose biosynthesis